MMVLDTIRDTLRDHCTVPYALTPDIARPCSTKISVYCSNAPGSYSMRQIVDTCDNYWWFNWSGWHSDRGSFLMESVRDYLPPQSIWPLAGGACSYSNLLFSSNCQAIVTTTTAATTPSARCDVPVSHLNVMTAHVVAETYSTHGQVSHITGSSFRYGIFRSDSIAFAYSRDDVDSTQQEDFIYDGPTRSVLITNPDSVEKKYSFVFAVSPADSEIAVRIVNERFAENDSIRYRVAVGNRIQIDNLGDSTVYSVSIDIAGANTNRFRSTDLVPLKARCAHLILPDWRPFGDKLKVLVDCNMDGTYEDSMFVIQDRDCRPGDANNDNAIDIADAVFLITFIFGGGHPPVPYAVCSGDANCDCSVDISDAVFLISYIFSGGSTPCTCGGWIDGCGLPLRK